MLPRQKQKPYRTGFETRARGLYVQTFLPWPSFRKTAKILDNKRLNKQIVECWQILRTIRGVTKGWRNHPAVKMWVGYEDALILYAKTMQTEWRRRGYISRLDFGPTPERARIPHWWGDERVYRSHRSNLKRKDPEHYKLFEEAPDIGYYWPAPQPD